MVAKERKYDYRGVCAVDDTVKAALWGAAGAFLIAGSEWLACAFSDKGERVECTARLLTKLIAGAIGAAAFSDWAMDWFNQKFPSAVSAVIGLAINTVAPRIRDGLNKLAERLAIGGGDAKS